MEEADDQSIDLVLTRTELNIVVGGIAEAVFELGDDEFAIRVGPSADEARTLLNRLTAIRRTLE